MSTQPTTQQQGQYNRVQISSSLISWFDEGTNQLRLAGFESGLKIDIWVPEIDPTGRKTYPQEKRCGVVVRDTALAAFEQLIIDDFLPCFKEGKSCTIGVYTTYDRSTKVELITDGRDAYMRISKGIVEGTPASTFTYKFQKNHAFTSANGEETPQPFEGQLYLFIRTIRAYLDVGFNGVAGHSNRIADSYSSNLVFNHIKAIAYKVGADVRVTNNYQRPTQTQQASNAPGVAMQEAQDYTALLN